MKRAAVAVAAVLTTLALAASAEAKVPPTHGGSILGRNLPLKIYASVDPAVHLFGDPITAKVAVVADRRWVAPANVRVIVHFAPYKPAGPPTEERTGNGRLLQMTWTWKLRCLTMQCLPVTKRSDLARVFPLSPAHVQYLSPEGKVRYALYANFQRIAVLSQLSPSEVAALGAHRINWYYRLTPLPAPHYRTSPGLLFWLAVALAFVFATSGLALAARWTLRLLPSRAAHAPAGGATSLERALTLFFWARANDDETLQRKALERVADELPFDVHELSETARALAWSPETPETEDVEAISERAGIQRRNGEPER